MVGGVMSRTVMVWTALGLLPHWSVAVQVRAMTLVGPQFVVTTSLYVTVAELHPSCAIAAPVKFVAVLVEGHSSTTFVGMMRPGLVVSRTVIVCMAVALLLHWSVALQVRQITLFPAQLLLTTSL